MYFLPLLSISTNQFNHIPTESTVDSGIQVSWKALILQVPLDVLTLKIDNGNFSGICSSVFPDHKLDTHVILHKWPIIQVPAMVRSKQIMVGANTTSIQDPYLVKIHVVAALVEHEISIIY